MKGLKVLDSSALLAYLGGEPGGKRVTEILKEASEGGRDLLLSVVHWGEILYVIESRFGKAKRDGIERLLDQMHLEVVDVEKGVVRTAAHWKATLKLPYVDALGAALAFSRGAELVTADEGFRTLEGKIPILRI